MYYDTTIGHGPVVTFIIVLNWHLASPHFHVQVVDFYVKIVCTLDELVEDLFDIVAGFGRYFPAVNVKFILILADRSISGYFSPLLEINFVADDHEDYLVEIQVLVLVIIVSYLPVASMIIHRGSFAAP